MERARTCCSDWSERFSEPRWGWSSRPAVPASSTLDATTLLCRVVALEREMSTLRAVVTELQAGAVPAQAATPVDAAPTETAPATDMPMAVTIPVVASVETRAEVAAAPLVAAATPAIAAPVPPPKRPAVAPSPPAVPLRARLLPFVARWLFGGIRTLLAEFNVSRTSPYRMFEPLGGVSKHILERRLVRVHHQLTEADRIRHLGRLAEARGFRDTTHFSKAFRRMFGYRFPIMRCCSSRSCVVFMDSTVRPSSCLSTMGFTRPWPKLSGDLFVTDANGWPTGLAWESTGPAIEQLVEPSRARWGVFRVRFPTPSCPSRTWS